MADVALKESSECVRNEWGKKVAHKSESIYSHCV